MIKRVSFPYMHAIRRTLITMTIKESLEDHIRLYVSGWVDYKLMQATDLIESQIYEDLKIKYDISLFGSKYA